ATSSPTDANPLRSPPRRTRGTRRKRESYALDLLSSVSSVVESLSAVFRDRCRPSWWPENEPWPPRDARHRWRTGRGRFFRRVAAIVLILLTLSICGALALVWVIATRLGLFASAGQSEAAILIVGGMVGVAIVALGSLTVVRRGA